jgi:hypothetical protein
MYPFFAELLFRKLYWNKEMRVFLEVGSYSLVGIDRRFRGAYGFHHQGDSCALHSRRLSYSNSPPWEREICTEIIILFLVTVSWSISASIMWLQTVRPGFDPRQRQTIFPLASASRSGLRLPASYPVDSWGKARPGSDAEHSTPSPAEVKNESRTSSAHWSRHCVSGTAFVLFLVTVLWIIFCLTVVVLHMLVMPHFCNFLHEIVVKQGNNDGQISLVIYL